MAGRIETLVTAQHRLIGDISHELRSPLARLRVALEIARRKSGAEAGASLDRIELESDNLNELIGQLLMLSRLESGGSLEKTSVDLAALVREVAEDADFEAHSRHCAACVTRCDEATVNGVYNLLRSALENVVRNAVSYTAPGTEVEIAHRREAGTSVITVRDYGSGVPEDALEEIFRPFYRVEDARDRQTGGAGLGLSIAARAVRLHNGNIKAANANGGGLIVTIELRDEE
jgi:two-component system sensor histidine kinase CpxA